MNYEYAVQEAENALDILLYLDLSQEDIDSLRVSIHQGIRRGHLNPIDGAIALSALNSY
jgi:hypothetical protein